MSSAQIFGQEAIQKAEIGGEIYSSSEKTQQRLGKQDHFEIELYICAQSFFISWVFGWRNVPQGLFSQLQTQKQIGLL